MSTPTLAGDTWTSTGTVSMRSIGAIVMQVQIQFTTILSTMEASRKDVHLYIAGNLVQVAVDKVLNSAPSTYTIDLLGWIKDAPAGDVEIKIVAKLDFTVNSVKVGLVSL
jgi:hypothetical protein